MCYQHLYLRRIYKKYCIPQYIIGKDKIRIHRFRQKRLPITLLKFGFGAEGIYTGGTND